MKLIILLIICLKLIFSGNPSVGTFKSNNITLGIYQASYIKDSKFSIYLSEIETGGKQKLFGVNHKNPILINKREVEEIQGMLSQYRLAPNTLLIFKFIDGREHNTLKLDIHKVFMSTAAMEVLIKHNLEHNQDTWDMEKMYSVENDSFISKIIRYQIVSNIGIIVKPKKESNKIEYDKIEITRREISRTQEKKPRNTKKQEPKIEFKNRKDIPPNGSECIKKPGRLSRLACMIGAMGSKVKNPGEEESIRVEHDRYIGRPENL